MIIIDQYGTIHWADNYGGFAHSLRYPRENLSSISEIITDASFKLLSAAIDALHHGSATAPAVVSVNLRSSDESGSRFDVHVFPIPLSESPTLFVVTAPDTIPRFTADELDDNTIKYLLEQSGIHYYQWELGASGSLDSSNDPPRSRYIGDAIRELLGVDPGKWGESIENWIERIHPDDKPTVLSTLSECVADRKRVSMDYRLRRQDGSWLWARDIAQIIDAGDHGRLHVHGILTDISSDRAQSDALISNLQRYRSLFAHHKDAVFSIDSEGRFQELNDSCERISGYRPDELIGRPFAMIVVQDELQKLRDLFVRSSQGESHNYLTVIRHKNGKLLDLDVSTVPIFVDGVWCGVFGIARDVSQERATQRALVSTERRYRTLVEQLPVITYVVDIVLDENGRIDDYWWSYISPQVTTMVGVPQFAWTKHRDAWLEPIPQEERDRVYSDIAKHVERLEPFSVEYPMIRTDGDVIWVRDEASPIIDDSRRHLSYQGVIYDITSSREMEQQLRYRAEHDTLTGLPNRAFLLNRLPHALSSAQAHGSQLALMFLDLDRFKHVNDSHGHQAGDQLLTHVGQRLTRIVRRRGIIARIAGDEFTVLAEDIRSLKDVHLLAKRILAKISEPFSIGGHTVSISTSIGITVSDGHVDAPDQLLREADIALYQAKQDGRSRIAFYDPEMTELLKLRTQLERDLKEALGFDQLELYVTAEHDLETRQPVTYDVFVRWNHPIRGVLLQKEFLPIAEDLGLLANIQEWMIKKAIEFHNNLYIQKISPEIQVSVNLPGLDLHHDKTTRRIARLIRDFAIAPDSLRLEIPEHTLCKMSHTSLTDLSELGETRVKLAIDRFDNRCGLIDHLKDLPFDTIKLHPHLTRQLSHDPRDQAGIRAILAAANALGLNVVASGIQSEHHCLILQSLGVQIGQGPALSAPMEINSLLAPVD